MMLYCFLYLCVSVCLGSNVTEGTTVPPLRDIPYPLCLIFFIVITILSISAINASLCDLCRLCTSKEVAKRSAKCYMNEKGNVSLPLLWFKLFILVVNDFFRLT